MSASDVLQDREDLLRAKDPAQRAQLLCEIEHVLDQPDVRNLTGDSRKTVVRALYRAANIRSIEIVDTIVSLADFHVSELGNRGLSIDAIPSKEQIYPALVAIKAMGKEAVPSIIERLAKTQEKDALALNLMSVLRDIVDYRTNLPTRQLLLSNSQQKQQESRRLMSLSENMDNFLGPEQRRDTVSKRDLPDIAEEDKCLARMNLAAASDDATSARAILALANDADPRSVKLIAEKLDLKTASAPYPAVDSLTATGKMVATPVARAMSVTRRSREYIKNGLTVLLTVLGSKEATRKILIETSEQRKLEQERLKYLAQLLDVS